MAKATSKPAGKFKVPAGPSGKMAKFTGVGQQPPDKTAVANKAGKGAPFAKGGPSGKMAKFKGVGTQVPDRTAVTMRGK
jgi:hypothetical protein